MLLKPKYFLLVSLIISCSTSFAQYNNIYEERAWEERDKWQKADLIIKSLNIGINSNVADIGCHEGYMSVKLAAIVKPAGKVFAVDIDEYKLTRLREILKLRELSEYVEVIKGDVDNPKLPENTLDAVLIMDTYHEMSDHMIILDHVMRALKPGGRFIILEPIADERKKWSRVEQGRKHEIAIQYVLDDIIKAGFEVTKKIDPFIDRTSEKGDKMWMIICEKPDNDTN